MLRIELIAEGYDGVSYPAPKLIGFVHDGHIQLHFHGHIFGTWAEVDIPLGTYTEAQLHMLLGEQGSDHAES